MTLDREHVYRNEKGDIYRSVGEVIGQYKPDFPAALIAQQTAKKTGRTPEDVLEEWDINKQASCDYGNGIHRAIEYWIRWGKTHKLFHLDDAVTQYARNHDRLTLFSEVIVYSHRLKIAGTIDQIERVYPGIVYIRDVKTNADLQEKAKGKFLPPFESLPCSKLNEYALKLSLYAQLFEEMRPGVKVQKLLIDHWDGTMWTEIELPRINLQPILT